VIEETITFLLSLRTGETKEQQRIKGNSRVEKQIPNETLSTTCQRSNHSVVKYSSLPRSLPGARGIRPHPSEGKERSMVEELRIPITVLVQVTPLLQAASSTLQVERITIAPSHPTDDPLHHHIALLLQEAIEGKSVAGSRPPGQWADALVTPFLRRDGVTQQSPDTVISSLSPYKLRRTLAYIKDHLEQDLSLVTLAAVGETSPAHFSRLFKQTTGLPPHQYVLRCRMKRAQQLLVETDLPLSEIALQVGCTDQSHFTALFRTHFGLPPGTYRDHTVRQEIEGVETQK
jgi:AraC-like DNA-binding protein